MNKYNNGFVQSGPRIVRSAHSKVQARLPDRRSGELPSSFSRAGRRSQRTLLIDRIYLR
jgi:hypothetical protein